MDWQTKEISKTGAPLSCVLANDAGDALADCILNDDQKCGSDFVFLRSSKPHGNPRFQAQLRRRVSEGGGSVKEPASLMRLQHEDSAKPYLAADEDGLKLCALSPLKVEGGLGDAQFVL
ncbi:MAG: hypothetical protein LBU32_08000 [Clostridiales bacterium]|nr:hypothetical protein [Clostridiales bacterium]